MTPSLGTLAIDLPRLIETRLLIQSNSGGGKSHTLRRVLEQTAPHVQQLVLDPDGEFATLRERFDYIVCAPRGAMRSLGVLDYPSSGLVRATDVLFPERSNG